MRRERAEGEEEKRGVIRDAKRDAKRVDAVHVGDSATERGWTWIE